MTRTMRHRCIAAILMAMMLGPGLLTAQTILHVSKLGDDDTGNGSTGAPYKTIAKAIQIADPSSENPVVIRIALGVYTENLTLKDYMTLEGGYSYPGWIRNPPLSITTIKSASSDPGSITILAANPVVIDGLTIEGGYFGVRVPSATLTALQCTFKNNTIAGISALQAADVTVENCIFDKPTNGINLASTSVLSVAASKFLTCGQYGIFADNATLTVEDTRFDGCGQDGLYVKSSDVTLRRVISAHNIRNGLRMESCAGLIENSIFGDNDTGIAMKTSQAIPVYFCTLAGNRISAFVCDQSTPDLRNNIFSGSGEYGVEERPGTIGPARLTTNCFHGNLKADYLDGGTTPTLGAAQINTALLNGAGIVHSNIDGDPKILKPSHDNFQLAIGSSCLDAAEPIPGITDDVFGQPRPYDFPLVDANGPDPDMDIGAIEFRGVYHFDFARGDTGWILTTIPFFFNPPEGYAIPDKLLIRSNDTLTFGFWTSPFDRIPALPGKIYRVDWLISTDVRNRDRVPTFRLRALNETGSVSYTFGVNSAGPGESSPVFGQPMTYTIYFSPLQGGLAAAELSQIILGFDIMQFDVNDQLAATFYIEDVKITELDKADFLTEFNPVVSTDFAANGSSGWDVLPPLPAPITYPLTAATARGLEMTAVDNLFCFGSWFGPPVAATGQQTLYVSGRVGCDTADPATAPTFRLRLNALDNQTYCDMAVTSALEGDASPANGNVLTFGLFFEAPAVSMDTGILPVIDLMNFDPNDDPTATIWLQAIDIHARPR